MFGLRGFRPKKEKTDPKNDVGTKESDTNLTVQSTESNQSTKKTCWWRQLFKCCKRRSRVSPSAAATEGQKTSQRSSNCDTLKETNEQQKSSSSSHQDEVEQVLADVEDSCSLYNRQSDIFQEDFSLLELPDYNIPTEQDIIEVLPKEETDSCSQTSEETTERQTWSSFSPQDMEVQSVSDDDDFLAEQAMIEALIEEEARGRVNSSPRNVVNFSGGEEESSFGLPNIGMSCYMNSCLQSLLTLDNFVRDISCQERVWSSAPEAQLLRSFLAIRDVHSSTSPDSKRRLLHSFKEVVSVQAPEFRDCQQKDAHEFLTTVLDQMRCLSPVLQHIAASNGSRYTCPVENHLMFKLENTRTCRRCGAQSKRHEVFNNLSLDLFPGGSVEEMLQEYLKETELEFRCECGGETSGQRLAFDTLPRVLILHLKRFCFTSTYQMVKLLDPVVLDRDLVVSSKLSGGCYSLVSAVSHLGDSGASGHYVSDGVHPDDCPDDPSDRWLTYNDSEVTETTGAAVCEQLGKSAYILVYKRHV